MSLITPKHQHVTFVQQVMLTAGNQDGTAAEASFFYPVGIAVGRAGTLYVMDMIAKADWGFRVRKITAEGAVSTLVVVGSN